MVQHNCLSRLVCHISNLADKHGITFIPAYIPTYLSVEAHFQGKVGPQVASSSSHCQSSFPVLEATADGSVGFLMYHTMSALLHSIKSYQEFGVESIPSYVFPLLALIPLVLSKFLVEPVKSIVTSYSNGTMLGGGSLPSHSSPYFARCSSLVSHHKGSHHGCFVGQVLKGLHLTFWLFRDMCFTDKGSFPQCVR